MQHYKPSIIEDYVYNNENGILKGGYPLTRIAEQEEFRMKQLGGGLAESIGIEKFKDYAIPIGLFCTHETPCYAIDKYSKRNKDKHSDVINDEMFEHMFSKLLHKNKSRNVGMTRKVQIQHNNRKTKRNSP